MTDSREGRTPDHERGYTLTRQFGAPRAVVWQAITDPDLFVRWFGAGTDGVEVKEWDLQPGGLWRATMRYEGNDVPWVGRFLEIEEPARLVLAVMDAVDLGDTYEVLTMTLTESGGGTELVLRQSGDMSDEEYERAKEGTAGFLDALVTVVGGLRG
jgi:uncharacterized protein YndB with AHSA1/START domain